MKRGILVCGLVGLLCCGGQKSTLEVHILVPPDDDIFAGASQVRLSISDKVSTSAVAGGKFNVKIDYEEPPEDQFLILTVEALDGAGAVVGRGKTPYFVLVTQDGELTVYIGRPGQITRTAVDLLTNKYDRNDGVDTDLVRGRTQIYGAALRGKQISPAVERALGVLIGGGVDEAGNSLRSAWVYDPLTHRLVAASGPVYDNNDSTKVVGYNPPLGRRGAVAVPSADSDLGQQAIVWGGAAVTAGAEAPLPTDADLFDPSKSSISTVFGKPSPEVADAGVPGAAFPAVAEVQEGVFLVSGGRAQRPTADAPEVAVNQAVLLRRFPAPEGAENKSQRPGVRRIPPAMPGPEGPMVAARSGHTATAVTLADGPGALLFGGLLPSGMPMDERPVAEVFSLSRTEFRPLALVLEDMAPVPSRRGHVAAALKDGTVLVAGGMNQAGEVLDSALVIDLKTLRAAPREKFLTTARHGATLALYGGELLICGGLGADGKALATCEVYNPDGGVKSRDVNMPTARAGHLMLPLETEQLLLVGGVGVDGKPLASIDLYTPR